MRNISNRYLALLSCFFPIGIIMLLTGIVLMMVFIDYHHNEWILVVIAFVNLLLTAFIVFKKYLDIKFFPEYMIVREFYLFNSLERKPLRTMRVTYYELTDFIIDDHKQILLFELNYRPVFFSSRYLVEEEKKALYIFLKNKIKSNEKPYYNKAH